MIACMPTRRRVVAFVPGRRARAGATQSGAVLLGVAAAILIARIDVGPMIPTSSVTPILLGVAGALFGAIAVVFSVLFLVVQWVASTFTPRLTLFRDAPIVWRTAAFAVGVIIFCVSAVLASAGAHQVSAALPISTIALLLVLLILFRSLLVYALTSTQISPVLASIGRHGQRTIETAYPGDDDQPTELDSLPPTEATVVWAGTPAVLQRIKVRELVRLAARVDAVIVFRRQIGTTLHAGVPVADVRDGRLGSDAVLAGLVGGAERTFDQDPLLAVRLLADIGLRAMSPAINDPASAVQALDELEFLLVRGLRMTGRPRHHLDHHGVVRLVVPRPSWEEMLRTAIDELITASLRSPLALRQLAGVLSRLRDTVTTDGERALLVARLDWVHTAYAAGFPELAPDYDPGPA